MDKCEVFHNDLRRLPHRGEGRGQPCVRWRASPSGTRRSAPSRPSPRPTTPARRALPPSARAGKIVGLARVVRAQETVRPHRRPDLLYGWVEATGIRCSYHGWLMYATGRCVEQPYEDVANPSARAKDRCATTAYPVRELAGLLWAYLGPPPAPELPVWEPFTWPNGFREIVLADIPCNWFQCQENSIDPVHFEWMHDNWSLRLRGG